MDGVRMDKWLWAARLFKTRALAARACELGRVEANGHPAKASREVHAGDRLCVRTERGGFEIEVVSVSRMRGPASVAQTLYRETEASRAERERLAEERRAARFSWGAAETRPSKRERRALERLRGRG